MKRPVGVTVVAVINIASAALLGGSYALPPAQRPEVAFFGFPIVIVIVLASVGLGVGLLKLRSWARSITVLFCWLHLFGALSGMITAVLVRQRVSAVGDLLGGLFAAWVLWYLSKPEVITAFRLREDLALRQSLSLRYRFPATEGATAIPNSTKQDLEARQNETAPVSVTLFGRNIDMREPRE